MTAGRVEGAARYKICRLREAEEGVEVEEGVGDG
jgi:hypothetical protein